METIIEALLDHDQYKHIHKGAGAAEHDKYRLTGSEGRLQL
jgi:hypothetical protein